jgi:hypothetical protein
MKNLLEWQEKCRFLKMLKPYCIRTLFDLRAYTRKGCGG